MLQLMEWMHLHFVQVDRWVAKAGSSEDPENSPQYWNAVSGALYVAHASGLLDVVIVDMCGLRGYHDRWCVGIWPGVARACTGGMSSSLTLLIEGLRAYEDCLSAHDQDACVCCMCLVINHSKAWL